MTQPKDKSQLSIAERTKQVLRVNQSGPMHVIQAKLPATALPAKNNLFKRDTYVVGDGERMQSGRPGADDHLKVKSRGHSV
jgi:hypothetical protein